MQNLMSCTLCATLLTSMVLTCSAAESAKSDSGITLQRGDMTIDVEVVNESIIHVTKTRDGVVPDTLPDYVTTLDPQRTKWKAVTADDGTTTLTTSEITLSVDTEGVISYRDKSGNDLVSESAEATYIYPKGAVSQGFTAGDEAIYGLGQYQSGAMNLRALPVSMDHSNQEIVIPFVVSTKGYGIYWHNYSVTTFNRPTNKMEFADVEISPELEAAARTGVDAEDVANRKERNLKLNLRSRKFTPTKSGLHTFLVESNTYRRMKGDIKLIIDNDTIINYSTIWAPLHYSGSKVLEAGKEYTILFQNDGAFIAGNISYNEPDFDKTTFTSNVGTKIEYYIVAGGTPQSVLKNYQDLTGYAPMFEKKSYGFWHCRERFHNQKNLLENAREYRQRGIPVDNIVQDWQYWPTKTKGPEWDRGKFPDPKAMTAELDSLNINLMVSVWPMMNNKGITARYDLAQHLYDTVGYYIDFYDERAQRTFYKILSDSMFRMGVKSIWLDGSEPKLPNAKSVLGRMESVENSYSLLVSKSVYDGHREEFPDERVFNLTRSAYAGQQRYGVASWSGDVAATWEQFGEQISAGLNFTMAGVPYWTHDIGGFFRDSRSMNPIYDDQYTNQEYIELLSRWFQFGTFSPIFRLHGYVSQTEVWRYGAEFEALARKYIGLRYALMPYIYSEAWRVTNEGRVMMSHLSYSYPEDKKVWEIDDQYLFGESMMICPVVEAGARTREVYLPEGVWFDYWSGTRHEGGECVSAAAELDQLPIYIKAGSIIPFGGAVQYATEPTDEPIRVKIYGGADGEFTLYLDDEKSYKYEEGIYSELSFSYDESAKSLTIESPTDNYTNFKKSPMTLVVELVESGEVQDLIFSGKRITVKL
ncbi:MAG: glycoside hydrolase family 31 protein [Rikenellaceae bacterium]